MSQRWQQIWSRMEAEDKEEYCRFRAAFGVEEPHGAKQRVISDREEASAQSWLDWYLVVPRKCVQGSDAGDDGAS